MRTLLTIGLAGLALMGGAVEAEARGGRIRFSWPRARGAMPAVPQQIAPAPAFAVRPSVGVRPTYVVLPPPSHIREPVEARSAVDGVAPAVKVAAEAPAPGPARALVPVEPMAEAAPWCSSRKVVGSGAGFCMVNCTGRVADSSAGRNPASDPGESGLTGRRSPRR